MYISALTKTALIIITEDKHTLDPQNGFHFTSVPNIFLKVPSKSDFRSLCSFQTPAASHK